MNFLVFLPFPRSLRVSISGSDLISRIDLMDRTCLGFLYTKNIYCSSCVLVYFGSPTGFGSTMYNNACLNLKPGSVASLYAAGAIFDENTNENNPRLATSAIRTFHDFSPTDPDKSWLLDHSNGTSAIYNDSKIPLCSYVNGKLYKST